MLNKQLILHIGAPKTGSTAIQVFCARNIKGLETCGIHYPSDYYVELAAQGQKTPGNGVGLARFLNDELPGKIDGEVWWQQFEQFLADNTAPQVLYSSEYLWPAHEERLLLLQQVAVAAGYRVRIIAYIRSQDSYIKSAYAERVKALGETRSFMNFLLARDQWPLLDDDCFVTVLGRYERVFGRDALQVRVFDTAQFVGADLITDFLRQLAVPESAHQHFSREDSGKVNTSASFQELEIMRRLNRFVSHPLYIEKIPLTYRMLTGKGRDDAALQASAEAQQLLLRTYGEEVQSLGPYLQSQSLRLNKISDQPRQAFKHSGGFVVLVGLLNLGVATLVELQIRLRRVLKRFHPGTSGAN